MDSGSWLPMYGDGWYATLAEFDTWESGFDFSDAPTTFDEAAAARVSCTPLTDEERAANAYTSICGHKGNWWDGEDVTTLEQQRAVARGLSRIWKRNGYWDTPDISKLRGRTWR